LGHWYEGCFAAVPTTPTLTYTAANVYSNGVSEDIIGKAIKK